MQPAREMNEIPRQLALALGFRERFGRDDFLAGPPNAAALALMPDSYRTNTAIFPPPAAMARCEYAEFEGLKRAQLYDETLTRIFAA